MQHNSDRDALRTFLECLRGTTRLKNPTSHAYWTVRYIVCSFVRFHLLLATVLSAGVRVQAIDDSVVLSIGEMQISQYIIDKNYDNFVKTGHGDTINASDKQAWFEAFLARLIVTAHARELGYEGREEVLDTVSKMERHMLTTLEGPFYKSLLQIDIPPSSIEKEKKDFHVSYYLIAARFESKAALHALLGVDFLDQNMSVQEARLSRLEGDAEHFFFEGQLCWPFEPYRNLASRLRTWDPEGGTSLIQSETINDISVALVRQRHVRQGSDPSSKQIENYIAHSKIRDTQLKRHRNLLSESSFRMHEAALSQLFIAIRDHPGEMSTVPFKAIKPFEDEPLFEFDMPTGHRSVCVGEYIRYFNEQFIRSLPRNEHALRRGVEGYVVSELDFIEAKSQKVDYEPQFIQNRINFTNAQILDVYEREHLFPKVIVEPAQVTAFYKKNRSRFTLVSKCQGRLLVFDKALSAEWAADMQTSTKEARAIAVEEITNYVVEIGKTIDAFNPLEPILLNAKEGDRIGPIPDHGRFLVFAKEENVESQVIPLKQVSDEISDELRRNEVERRSIQLGKSLVGKYNIIDNINYKEYGVNRPIFLRQKSE